MATDDDSAQLYATAIHEAAHAIAAIAFGIRLDLVCIERQELANGVIAAGSADGEVIPVSRFAGKGDEIAIPRLIQLLAGLAAEAHVNPHVYEEKGYQDDFAGAWEIARVATCGSADMSEVARNQPRARALLEAAGGASNRFVEDNWHAIEAVAKRLIEQKKLTGDEVALIDAGLRPKSPAIRIDRKAGC